MRKGVGLDLPKYYLISMNSYIAQANDNFFHRTIENFAINFIVFMHYFKPR